MLLNEKPLVPINELKLNWKQFSKAFLNASPNAIVVTDRSSKAILSNEKAQDSLEIFTGTLLQTTLQELTRSSAAVLKNNIAMGDIEIRRNNQKFMTRISPIIWNGFTLGLLYVFENITALEKVSQKMRSYQELSMELDTIINSSHDGILICDGQGKVIQLNPASEHLSGIKRENVIGLAMQELVDKRVVARSVSLKVLNSQKKETIVQDTKSGNKLLLTGTPVFDKDGRLFRVVVNERDITEIQDLRQKIDEKQALKEEFADDLLEMQLEAVKSKRIIAKSLDYKLVLEKAIKIGRVNSNVLILGESGTGKGVIAEMIHYHSKQCNTPMIKLNCGTIPDALVESELFGYKKGAFTGADRNKAGRFEMADKGILFLDEIGELPLASQVKILRFLEDGYLSRIGDTVSKRVDVRIIAATNQDLEEMVAEKKFRKDLYYRLNVIPINLPPLRMRRACILPLISHYMNHFCKKHGIKGRIFLDSHAKGTLENYAYPGNVRELINICERLVVMNESNTIHYKDLPSNVVASTKHDGLIMDMQTKGSSLREMMDAFECQILKNTMTEHLTQSKAAKVLGLNQSNIARKLQKHKLL
ncbi:sigma-54 dependent transcriptional regulator [Desulforapulum autotrophicum HRM2]|uniref:Sigma-54 dependent transcriptional regulator n=1 Tax=Desulforapulum autotrophicum (strain ATCC 43914 / DSM 3382 / VKM B-1955 / HRM2) TaxID=177437 RepID=C0Q9G3_DESAH|nr:sigma 54-interacting transcriptional regulator [Desulforapulum autotrophicum]ACN14527.1 sigma-54 dependent transcriptional regulator [Desulforapulum autotrophicum HRM2]